MATQRLYQELYPVDHPNYSRPIDQDIEAIKAMTVADLVGFHGKLGLGDFLIAAVGDVDAQACGEAVKTALGGWKASDLKIEPPKVGDD